MVLLTFCTLYNVKQPYVYSMSFDSVECYLDQLNNFFVKCATAFLTLQVPFKKKFIKISAL